MYYSYYLAGRILHNVMKKRMNINSNNIESIVRIILSIYGFCYDKTETVLLTPYNYTIYGRQQTQYDYIKDVIFFYNAPDLTNYQNLHDLAHECWHVVQKNRGDKLGYSQEHVLKYCSNENHLSNHMFMLYKFYDFECEAEGYAQAFVFNYLKTISYIKKQDVANELKEFSKPVFFTKEDVDSEDDYSIISRKLECYYNKGCNFFKNQIENTSLRKEILEICNNLANSEEASFLLCAFDKNNFVEKMIKLYNIV